MALISEWMEQCGKKVLDNAGIVRGAIYRQPSSASAANSTAFVDLPSYSTYHTATA
jgi:hypothetical protein